MINSLKYRKVNAFRHVYLLISLLIVSACNANADNLQSLQQMYEGIKSGQISGLAGEPVHIISDIGDIRQQATIYAILPATQKAVIQSLRSPQTWCQFITLHLNIKACTYQLIPQQTLVFYAGRKFYEPPEDAYELSYRFYAVETGNDLTQIDLRASEGPVGTSDYHLSIEILPIQNDLFMSISMSYNTSMRSRIASSIYLATLGADKMGFSLTAPTSKDDDTNNMNYIKGEAGVIERNVMRYFLAISCFLRQPDASFMILADSWFELTEQYHQQLHEVEKAEYLDAKKKEFENQLFLQRQLLTGTNGHDPDNTD